MANAMRQEYIQDNQDLQAMNSLFSNKLVKDGAKFVGGLAVSGAKAVGRGVGNMFGSKAYGGPVKKYQKGGPNYGQVSLEKYEDPNDDLAYLKAVEDKYGPAVLSAYNMNPYDWDTEDDDIGMRNSSDWNREDLLEKHPAVIRMFKKALESDDTEEIDAIITQLEAYEIDGFSPSWIPGTEQNIVHNKMPEALRDKKDFLTKSKKFIFCFRIYCSFSFPDNAFNSNPYAGRNTTKPTTIFVSVLFCATICQLAPIHDRLPSASNDPANAT